MAFVQVFASLQIVQPPPMIWMPEQSMLSVDGDDGGVVDGSGEVDGSGVVDGSGEVDVSAVQVPSEPPV